MTDHEFFTAMLAASTLGEALAATEDYFESTGGASWVPVGDRENNRGTIEVSADPGRALVERVTNGIDAVLEQEHALHGGLPDCKAPREAATAWLNVPGGGLSQMTPQQRQTLARRVTVTLLPGDTKGARVLDIRDLGTGLSADEMPKTILSLNASNKMTKHYLAGAYGQGGSSTLAASTLTFIAARAQGSNEIAFTVARFHDLPPEEYKTGHYVYLVVNGKVPNTIAEGPDFPPGTLVRHYGYDLSGYSSPLGPGSVYGLLNQTLFDPVMPVWFDNRVHNYRRVIKGSRNALNGAVDEGDDSKTGPALSHHIPMLYIPVDESGRIGVEYWVLEKTKKGAKPTASFVNPSRPILLTLNGQAQAEMPALLIKKDAELAYLPQRLICHIDCNSLTPAALRQLFVSNREAARSGALLQTIRKELVNLLRSDDELVRLNNEARNATMKERDEEALLDARKAVAKLLKLQGLEIADIPAGSTVATKNGKTDVERVARPRKPRPSPAPIELHDPPTYIRIVWEDDGEIPFYAEQRRYIRIETDAASSYHDATNPHSSRVNFIVTDGEVAFRASTPLQGGRMRALFECLPSAKIGGKGTIKVELSRPGLAALSDQREFAIVKPPQPKEDEKRISLPPFDFQPVHYGEEAWETLDWPDDVNTVASSAENDQGTHMLYYSLDFPPFKARFDALERRNPDLAKTYEKRYRIWLVVHSLLYEHQQKEKIETDSDADDKQAESERTERIRVATLSAMIAAREVQLAEASGANMNLEEV